MNNFKRILALVLSLTLVVCLAACGSSGSTSTATTAAAAAAAPAAADASAAAPAEDIPTIKVQLTCLNVPADLAMVEEAISALTREKVGANVEFIATEIANQNQQISLLLSAGDDSIDVFHVNDLANTVSIGQAMDLTDYIAPYAEGVKAALTESVYECGFLGDRLYGLPRLLDQASTATYSLPASVAAEFGYKNGDQASFEELDALFAKVHEAYPDVPLIGPNNGHCMIGETRVDQLGTSYYLGVLCNYGQGTEVTNYYESAEFMEMMQYVEKWSKAGYYMTDVLNVTEAPIDYIGARRAMGCFASHFSAEMNGIWQSDNFGEDMCCLSIYTNAYAKTPTYSYCVNPNTKNPEKAVAVLSLFATDPEVINMVVNGIEGVHYQVKEDGSATYADGVDSSNCGWCIGYSWANLNSSLSLPFNYPANYFDLMKESNATALKSTAFGFKLNTDNISDEIAACTNVYNQYYKTLFSDAIEDYAAQIEVLQSEMKAAGIDKIVAEKQAQLDAFLGK